MCMLLSYSLGGMYGQYLGNPCSISRSSGLKLAMLWFWFQHDNSKKSWYIWTKLGIWANILYGAPKGTWVEKKLDIISLICYFVPSKSFWGNEICYFVPSKSFQGNEICYKMLYVMLCICYMLNKVPPVEDPGLCDPLGEPEWLSW